jgi:hypothetical protein
MWSSRRPSSHESRGALLVWEFGIRRHQGKGIRRQTKASEHNEHEEGGPEGPPGAGRYGTSGDFVRTVSRFTSSTWGMRRPS